MSRTIELPDSMADALSQTLKQELENLVNRTAEIRKVLGELQTGTTATTMAPSKRPYTRRAPKGTKKHSKGTKALSFTRKPGEPTITDTILNIVASSKQPMSVSQVCTEFNKLKGFKKLLSSRHSSSISAILYQHTAPNKPLTREQLNGTWVYRHSNNRPSVTSKVETSDNFPEYKGPRNQAGQPGPNHFIN
jgi:hypothetical protein